ncbi:MAG: translation initiation factor IF-2 N-terminal domain-containing protein, partial [Bradyrhizobium sp.]
MVDTKSPGDKTLSVPTKTLTLKPRVETGTVRQSFSHGRTKQVVVEKRGKRRVGGDAPGESHAPEPVVAKPAPVVAKAPSARPAAPAAPRAGSGVVLRTLTEDERSARASALADAKVRDIEERRLAEEEAKRRSSKEGIEQAEREAAEARRKAEEERHRLEEEAKRKAELEAKKRFGEAEAKTATTAAPGTTTARPATRPATTAAVPPARAPGVAADGSDEDEGPRQIRRGPGGAMRPAVPPKTTHKPGPQKERGRLTLVTALDADNVRERSIASFRRRTQRLKGHASNEPKEKIIREVVIPEAINIQELANRMSERAVDVIRLLMKQGAMHKITDVIDADTAQLIAEEMGHTVKRVAASDVEEGLFDVVDDSSDTEPRSPV